MLAHPSLEGENLWDKADVDGFLFVRDMTRKGDAGGGLTYYQWGLPDNPDKVAPKISYTEVNPHWGWYISAGSYMEDYNNGANRVLDILLVTLGASLLVGMVIILLFSHHLAKPLQATPRQRQRPSREWGTRSFLIRSSSSIGRGAARIHGGDLIGSRDVGQNG